MFRRLRKHSTQDDNNNNNNNNTNNVENNHHRSAAVSSRSASEGNIADNHLSLPPFSEALSLPLISEPSTRRRRRSGRSSNPNCSRTCSGSRRRRRSQRNLRIEQLVANEIGSILLDQDWNQTSNDSPPPPLQRRPSRRNSQPRVSFSFLRSMRSVHIESTQEQEPQPEQQRAASESTTTHNMARRRSSRRHSISDEDENESDDCSLADSDTINIYSLFGGDPQKSCSTAVIYSQDYTLAVAPLFVFLACIFIILIVVRILVALLTMAMGYMAVVLGVAALVDFLRHPMWNTRKLLAATHYAPVLVFGGLGGFLSACRVMYVHGRWDEASVVWGLLEGLVYGVGLGALWLLVFGDASDHSRVTLWIFQGWGRLCDCCNVADYDDIDDNDPNTTNARSCMICLEPCRDKLQTLPCLHGFHPDCLEQWLLVKRSCPICRVAIDSSPIIPMTIEE